MRNFFANLKPFLFTQQCGSGIKKKCDKPSRPIFIIWGCGVANLVTSWTLITKCIEGKILLMQVVGLLPTSGCPWRSDKIRLCLPFFFSFTPNPSPKKPKYLKPNTLFFFFSKNYCINPGQPVGKGRKKKTGINPGQPAGKGRKKEKKNPAISPGQPAGKGREKKKKKTLVLTLGRPPDLDFRTWSCPSVEILSVRRGPETKIGTWTDGQTAELI